MRAPPRFHRLHLLAALTYLCTASNVSAQEPELIYYKFDEPSGTTTANFAQPGVGSNPATINGHTLGGVGQFNGSLIGVGGSSSTNYVDTGWPTALGTGDWTVGFWLDNTSTGAGTSLQYVLGDNTASSWRVFTGGVAGVNNIIMRGGGLTDITITGGGSATSPVVVAWVYDSVANQVLGYLNGALNSTVPQGAPNLTGTSNMKIGGYSGSACLFAAGLMDEVRVYNRALDATEIAATWNIELGSGPGCTINSPAMGATVGGTVMVDYDATHTMGLTVDATFEYSLDMGMTWQPATATGASTNPTFGIVTPSTGLIFEWDSVADMIGLLVPTAADFRISVIDSMMGASDCSVTGLTVDNLPPPPTCTIAQTTPGPASGQISFDLTPDSLASGTVDAQFDYSLDGGATYLPATPGGTSTNPLIGAPIMAVASFEWDSRADGVALVALVPGVLVRATVDDGTPLTGSCETPPFDVDNTSLCPGTCGDCDSNGMGPDILDALIAAQISAGLVVPSMAQQGCCDVNSSMAVEIIDALLMAQASAGLSVSLACP